MNRLRNLWRLSAYSPTTEETLKLKDGSTVESVVLARSKHVKRKRKRKLATIVDLDEVDMFPEPPKKEL